MGNKYIQIIGFLVGIGIISFVLGPEFALIIAIIVAIIVAINLGIFVVKSRRQNSKIKKF